MLRRLVSATRHCRIFCRDLRLHWRRLDVRVKRLDVGIGGVLLASWRLVAGVLPLERSSLIGAEDAAISFGAAALLRAATGER